MDIGTRRWYLGEVVRGQRYRRQVVVVMVGLPIECHGICRRVWHRSDTHRCDAKFAQDRVPVMSASERLPTLHERTNVVISLSFGVSRSSVVDCKSGRIVAKSFVEEHREVCARR